MAALAVAGLLGVLGLGGAAGWFFFVRVSDPVQRAETLGAKGDLRGALVELRGAARHRPEDGRIRLALGQVLLQVFEPVAAEKELRAARSLGVGQWVVTPLLGEALVAQGRWADVLNDVPRGGPSTVVVARDLLWRSMAQIAQNDVFAAQTSLALAREGAPDRVEVPLIAAYVARAQGDKAAAEAAVDEVLRREPALLDALLLKREMLSERGDATGATEEARAGAKAESMALANRAVAAARWSPVARLQRANLLMAAGSGDAWRDVEAVLARFPRYPAANYLHGVLLSQTLRFQEAAAAFEKVQPWIEAFPRIYYFKAVAAMRVGPIGAAMELAGRYHALVPNDVSGLLLLAQTQVAGGRADLAVPLLESAVAGGLRSATALEMLGAAYATAGNADMAVEIFAQAVAASPHDLPYETDLAMSRIGQGDVPGAREMFEKAAHGRFRLPIAMEGVVLASLELGEVDRAQAELDRFSAMDKSTATMGVLAGQMLVARSDLAGAQAAYLATSPQSPLAAHAKVGLAKVLVLQGRQAEGEKLLQEVLADDPADFEALTTTLQFLLQNDKYKGAIEAMEKARAVLPFHLVLPAMEGDLLVRSGAPQGAVALLGGVRDAGGRSPIVLGALARAQVAAEMNEEAKATYRDLVQAMPRHLETRRAQVALLLQLHEVDAAKAALRDALAAVPGAFPVMSSLVALEGQTAGLPGALQMAADIRMDPANLPDSTLLKGDALMASRRFGEAAEAYRAEYSATPSGALARRAAEAWMAAGQNDAAALALRVWLAGHGEDVEAAQMLAGLDVAARNYDEAATWLEFVLSRRPRDPVSLNNLAWIYQSKGDKRSRALAQQAYLQTPTAHTADTLGWIMVQQGDAKAAVPLLRQAVQPGNGRAVDGTLVYHLAAALKDDGKGSEAVALLRPIVTGSAAFEDRAAATRLLGTLEGRQ